MEKLPTLEKEQERFQSKIELVRADIYESEKPKGTLKVVDLLVKEGAKEISLKTLIPEGIELRNRLVSREFAYNPGKKVLFFSSAHFESLEGRLALLHEIGHAKDYEENSEVVKEWDGVKETWRKIRQAQLDMAASAPPEFNKDPQRAIAYQKENLPKLIKTLGIPPDQLSKLIKVLARNERAAWTEALKLYRRIKKDSGIDFLGGAKNKEIIQAVENPLASYDIVFRQLLPEQQLKLFLVKKFSKEAEGQ